MSQLFDYNDFNDSQQERKHPYRRLGGDLHTAMTIIRGIASTLLAIAAALVLFGMFAPREVTTTFLQDIGLLGMIVFLALTAILMFVCTALVTDRSTNFLCIFELSAIVGVLFAACALIGCVGLNIVVGVGALVLDAAYFVLFTRYFTSSVRVRTYFNSDEYLRKSIFFKNKTSVAPAAPDLVDQPKLERIKVSKDYKPTRHTEKPKVCRVCGAQNYANETRCPCGEFLR